MRRSIETPSFRVWSEGPDPESRDSGFDASHRPGMTAETVIARSGGRSSIPETRMMEAIGHSVLDTPHGRSMGPCFRRDDEGRECAHSRSANLLAMPGLDPATIGNPAPSAV